MVVGVLCKGAFAPPALWDIGDPLIANRFYRYIDSVYYQLVMLGARPPSSLSAHNVEAVESQPRHSALGGSHDPAN
jgi:hypothetical protein